MTNSQKAHKGGVKTEYRFGFTLSEVLITLVVIGIIAAITLPILIDDWHKQETISRLKKVYSTLSQTTNRAISDNGPIQHWEISTGGAEQFVDTFLLPYLNVSKNCKNDATGTCKYNYKTKNNINAELGSPYYRFYLSDGTFISAYPFIHDNGYTFVDMLVDINGQKKPNRVGRDAFWLRYHIRHQSDNNPIYNGKFVAVGQGTSRDVMLNNTNYGCKKGDGYYCGAIIFEDGFQISDDYPW